MKNYDVYFTLAHPASIVIEANSQEEAKEIAEELLADMDRNELIDRISNAIDFMGIKVTEATKC